MRMAAPGNLTRFRGGNGDRMETLVDQAGTGTVTPVMKRVAETEGMDPGLLRSRLAEGSIVIMQRDGRGTGIGKGLSTKINVNLGTSSTKTVT